MTAINHALTGTVIGLIVGEPLIAVPAALASHFVCDALPHFGSNSPDKWLKTKGFRKYLVTDAGLCVLLVGLLALFHPQHWLLAAICAFVATSPDLLWINKYLKISRGRRWKRNVLERLAGRIQWFAKPIGAVVEVAWFIGATIVILAFVH